MIAVGSGLILLFLGRVLVKEKSVNFNQHHSGSGDNIGRDKNTYYGANAERPFLDIKPFQYTDSRKYFAIEKADPKRGDFVLQFQLEIHNVGEGIAKNITFLKCEVRTPNNQIMTPATPIISTDLVPDAKLYPKLNLVIDASPADFKRLPSGKIQIVHNISIIELDVILKYSSNIDPKKEYRIDASYRISADSSTILAHSAS